VIKEMADKKKVLTSTKVVCAKCGKDHYVTFVADGHRKYFCEECLKVMHHNRKKGSVKKVFDPHKKSNLYEFVCDSCDNFRKATYSPEKIEGKVYCKECLIKKKAEDRKKNRKNVVHAKKEEESK
jgi:CxxC-x17-CxxC domain-containing protein